MHFHYTQIELNRSSSVKLYKYWYELCALHLEAVYLGLCYQRITLQMSAPSIDHQQHHSHKLTDWSAVGWPIKLHFLTVYRVLSFRHIFLMHLIVSCSSLAEFCFLLNKNNDNKLTCGSYLQISWIKILVCV